MYYTFYNTLHIDRLLVADEKHYSYSQGHSSLKHSYKIGKKIEN